MDEIRLHPNLAPQDVVKLCYQAAFGAEHLLSDHTQAKKYFQDEYAITPTDDKPLAEYIAPDVCRVNFSGWKRQKLNPDWLWRLFISATEDMPVKDEKIFANYMTQAGELCQQDTFPFTYGQWQEYIFEYSKAPNLPPVRHSTTYRENEKPAYRILSGKAAMAVPIFEKMADLDGGVIAIDGRAASGKTTLAGFLREIIPAEVIAMDDFFLPPKLRTADRLAQPGGNIHHERFIKEVLPYLKSGEGFKYRKFDCSQMEYSDTPIRITTNPWRIVEGVYSFHPVLGDYADIRVFIDIQPPDQEYRIKARNTPRFAADYFTKWIPMEEAYFKTYSTRESANVIIHVSV